MGGKKGTRRIIIETEMNIGRIQWKMKRTPIKANANQATIDEEEEEEKKHASVIGNQNGPTSIRFIIKHNIFTAKGKKN